MIQVMTVYNPTDDSMTPEEVLGNAIILQAVKDFRHARRRLKRRPDDRAAVKTVREISRFFRSRYFCLLTRLDGPSLLNRLMNEGSERHECA